MNKTSNVQKTETNGTDKPANNKRSVLQGLFIGLGILAMIAFWLVFVYAIWVQNMELVMVFAYIIAIGAGVFGTIHFLSRLRQDIVKNIRQK